VAQPAAAGPLASHGEPRPVELAFEGRVGVLGPDGEDPVRAQGGARSRESRLAVMCVVPRLRGGMGPLVEIQENGVDGRGSGARGLGDRIGHVSDPDFYALVVVGAIGAHCQRCNGRMRAVRFVVPAEREERKSGGREGSPPSSGDSKVDP
jgi:hypothetical protein